MTHYAFEPPNIFRQSAKNFAHAGCLLLNIASIQRGVGLEGCEPVHDGAIDGFSSSRDRGG